MTFPAAVRWGKSAYSWNTNPTARRCGGTKVSVEVSFHVSPPTRTDGGGGTIESGNRAEDRRLAAARRPEDGEDIACVAGQIEIEWDGTRLPKRDRQSALSHVEGLRGGTRTS